MVKREYCFIGLLAALLSACGPEVLHECPLPPKGFTEFDVIGAWGGDINTAWDSTIIVRGDGLYKQMIDIKSTGFKYEGDWKPWRVTYSDKGLPYLHLEGLMMCAYWWAIDCRTGKTGITPVTLGDTNDPFAGEYYWYDGCQKKWVDTAGEGVFMVFGIPRASAMPPRGIVLVPFTKSSDSPTGPAYYLRQR